MDCPWYVFGFYGNELPRYDPGRPRRATFADVTFWKAGAEGYAGGKAARERRKAEGRRGTGAAKRGRHLHLLGFLI
jgi:hypothetical protein